VATFWLVYLWQLHIFWQLLDVPEDYIRAGSRFCRLGRERKTAGLVVLLATAALVPESLALYFLDMPEPCTSLGRWFLVGLPGRSWRFYMAVGGGTTLGLAEPAESHGDCSSRHSSTPIVIAVLAIDKA